MNTIGVFKINTQIYRDKDEELERWIDRGQPMDSRQINDIVANIYKYTDIEYLLGEN